LVQTAERLTGLTMDHYVEVGMGGVTRMVDAVGGIDVCLDYDVDDHDSSLVWDTSKGTCQEVDGDKALAYSRMRKSDPTGDIGRAQRQRTVVSAVVSKAMSPTTLINPFRQDRLVDSGTRALTVDEDASTLDLAQMALAFRSASNEGLTGAPPIESLDYEPGGIGAAVLLQDTTAPDFFSKVRAGQLTTKDFDQP
ncbi:MAG: LytR family transcriptional regulator, partial [Actinomyces sp.]